VIHDVSGFVEDHPGGRSLIKSAVGKDATGLFNGGVYEHSNAAHNLLSTMRVGVLRGGQEVEVWKKQRLDMGKGEILRQVTRVDRLVEGAVAA
jgi:stearoyl-CoA desaturase (delta-9 desaturase)